MLPLCNDFISQFLKDFIPNNAEGIFISEDLDSFSFYKDCNPYIECDEFDSEYMGYSYLIKLGTSKLCIVFSDFDAAIKLPANGLFSIDYEDPYFYARYSEDVISNTIENEIAIYSQVSYNTKKFLMPNIFCMEVNGIKVYKQEKIKETYADNRLKREESNPLTPDVLSTFPKTFCPFPKFFEYEILENYSAGRDIIEETSFLSDIHYENIGYSYSNMPVCFDYGGYGSESFKFSS